MSEHTPTHDPYETAELAGTAAFGPEWITAASLQLGPHTPGVWTPAVEDDASTPSCAQPSGTTDEAFSPLWPLMLDVCAGGDTEVLRWELEDGVRGVEGEKR